MIHFNEKISQQDAQWIIEEVMPKQGWRIDRTSLGWLSKAHNKAFLEQVQVPSCSCEFKACYQMWYSRLGQYQQQIKDAATPKPKRGRKPNGEDQV